MTSKPEGDGSVLDNTLIYFSSEYGESTTHDASNIPVILAGRAGGAITPGRQIDHVGETPIANLLLSTLHAVGVPAQSFGEDGLRPLAGL